MTSPRPLRSAPRRAHLVASDEEGVGGHAACEPVVPRPDLQVPGLPAAAWSGGTRGRERGSRLASRTAPRPRAHELAGGRQALLAHRASAMSTP